MRGRVSQTNRIEENSVTADRFASKARLNLNDLLKKRLDEKKVDKKTNLLIISSATTVAAVVLFILFL